MTDLQRTQWLLTATCPKCGGAVATDGREAWCLAGACGYRWATMVKRGRR